MIKQCKKCGRETEEFARCSRNPDGLDRWCKECRNLANQEYRESNPDEVKAARREHYRQNRAALLAYKKMESAGRRDQKAKYDQGYRERQRETIRGKKREWERAHANDPVFRIKRNLRRRLLHALQGGAKCGRTFELIGCSAEELRVHLESLFLPGMTWENYGNGWHIDHIVPCAEFDMSNPTDQAECFHFSNLRPLWAKDNLSKKMNLPRVL